MLGIRHQGEVTCLAYSPALALLASGDTNKEVRIWDFDRQQLEAVIGPTPTGDSIHEGVRTLLSLSFRYAVCLQTNTRDSCAGNHGACVFRDATIAVCGRCDGQYVYLGLPSIVLPLSVYFQVCELFCCRVLRGPHASRRYKPNVMESSLPAGILPSVAVTQIVIDKEKMRLYTGRKEPHVHSVSAVLICFER